MTVDIPKARDFMATHARLLDRRRFAPLDGGSDAAGVLESRRSPFRIPSGPIRRACGHPSHGENQAGELRRQPLHGAETPMPLPL